MSCPQQAQQVPPGWTPIAWMCRLLQVPRASFYAWRTSTTFTALGAGNRVRTSLGRTGVCWDNAAAESFFAALKNELYHRETFTTRARARFAVADYIEVFYNRQWLYSTLGYRTPAEALTDHQRRLVA